MWYVFNGRGKVGVSGPNADIVREAMWSSLRPKCWQGVGGSKYFKNLADVLHGRSFTGR